MRVVSFVIGIVICVVIMAVGIFWITKHVATGGAALGLGLGGLIDVLYLWLMRIRSNSIGVEVTTDSITIFYRVSHLDSIDSIVCIVALVVPIVVFSVIWH